MKEKQLIKLLESLIDQCFKERWIALDTDDNDNWWYHLGKYHAFNYVLEFLKKK